MAKETVKSVKRTRLVKMLPTTKTYKDSNGVEQHLTPEQIAENRIANVKGFATLRLNKGIKAFEIFGNCCGKTYDYSKSDLKKAKEMAHAKVDAAFDSVESGQKVTETAFSL